jgi:hypothetical protein
MYECMNAQIVALVFAMIAFGHAYFCDTLGWIWVARSLNAPHGENTGSMLTNCRKDSCGLVLTSNSLWLRPSVLSDQEMQPLKDLVVTFGRKDVALGVANFIPRGHKNFILSMENINWLKLFIRCHSRMGYMHNTTDSTLPPLVDASSITPKKGTLAVFMLTHDLNIAPCTDNGQLSLAMCKIAVRKTPPQFCLAYTESITPEGAKITNWAYLWEVEHCFDARIYQQHAECLSNPRNDMQYIIL